MSVSVPSKYRIITIDNFCIQNLRKFQSHLYIISRFSHSIMSFKSRDLFTILLALKRQHRRLVDNDEKTLLVVVAGVVKLVPEIINLSNKFCNKDCMHKYTICSTLQGEVSLVTWQTKHHQDVHKRLSLLNSITTLIISLCCAVLLQFSDLISSVHLSQLSVW